MQALGCAGVGNGGGRGVLGFRISASMCWAEFGF